jgi:hypothetical protein
MGNTERAFSSQSALEKNFRPENLGFVLRQIKKLLISWKEAPKFWKNMKMERKRKKEKK